MKAGLCSIKERASYVYRDYRQNASSVGPMCKRILRIVYYNNNSDCVENFFDSRVPRLIPEYSGCMLVPIRSSCFIVRLENYAKTEKNIKFYVPRCVHINIKPKWLPHFWKKYPARFCILLSLLFQVNCVKLIIKCMHICIQFYQFTDNVLPFWLLVMSLSFIQVIGYSVWLKVLIIFSHASEMGFEYIIQQFNGIQGWAGQLCQIRSRAVI